MRKGRKFNRWIGIIGILSASCVVTGCYDRQELEQQAFVTSLGVDQAPGGLYDCTFQISLPKNPSSGGGGGSGKTPLAGSGPVTIRAHSIIEAMALANSSIERTMTMSHLTYILFGEDVAKAGLEPQIQPLVRFREFRRTVLVAVSKGKAREVMTAMKPELEQSPERMADSIADAGRRTGWIPVKRIHDFITALEEPHDSAMLPVMSVNETVKNDPKGKSDISGKVSYEAGQVKRQGGDPVEWMGAAVFHGDKLAGYLSGEEMRLMDVIRGYAKGFRMDMPDPLDPEARLALYVRRARPPQDSVTLSTPVKIQITVPLEADILSSGSKFDYTQVAERERLEDALAKDISQSMKRLLEKLYHQYGSDVVPLTEYIRPQFSTYQAYANYPWESRMRDADIQVNTSLNIRRFGVQMVPVQTHN